MSAPGKPPLDPSALELPPFSLDVETLDLGSDVKAVGLELLETENREPVRGKDAALIWAAVFPPLAANEFLSSISLATSTAYANSAIFTKFIIAKPLNAAWSCRSQAKRSSRSFSSASRARPSASALAVRRKTATPSWRRNFRAVASTPTNRHTLVTLFARSASRKTAGSRS
jgi:hypothetical protein